MKIKKSKLVFNFVLTFSIFYLFSITNVNAVISEALIMSSNQCIYKYGGLNSSTGSGDIRSAIGFGFGYDFYNNRLTIQVARGKYKVTSNSAYLDGFSGGEISSGNSLNIKTKNIDLSTGSPYPVDFNFKVLEQPSDCEIRSRDFKVTVYLNTQGLPDGYKLGNTTLENNNYNKDFCRIIREQATESQVSSIFGDSSIGAKYISNIKKAGDGGFAAVSAYYKQITNIACDQYVDRYQSIDERNAKNLVKYAIQLYFNASTVADKNKQWDDELVSNKCAGAGQKLIYKNKDKSVSEKGGLNGGSFYDASGIGNFCNISLPNTAAANTLNSSLTSSTNFDNYKSPDFNGLTCKYKCEGADGMCGGKSGCKNLDSHLEEDGSYNILANHEVVRTIVQINEYWAHYTFADACEHEPDRDVVACRRICEEYVEAYYGPPIAATAGLCFEYQVRVTSHVQCRTEIDTGNYPPKVPVCIPYPVCSNSSGWVGDQAGPTTEFDSCIKGCDGGKYTKECSNKCYKQTYANKQFGITKNSQVGLLNTATKMASNTIGGGDHYDCSPSWSGANTCGTYYSSANRTGDSRNAAEQLSSGSYICQNGFLKHVDSEGHVCEDNCSWYHSCSGMHYVNAEDSSANYDLNMSAFNDAVARCSADVTCSSSSATFKVTVKYKNGQNDDVKISYPYTTSGEAYDVLVSGETESDRQSRASIKLSGDKFASNAKSADELEYWRTEYAVNGEQHTLLTYDGCYANANDNRYYMGHWSFHGYWISNKGVLSLKRPGDTKGWTLRPDKFCLPFDAQDTNQDWWDYYHSHKDGTICNTDVKENINNICCVQKMKEKGSTLPNNIDYNIVAETDNFGYFGTPVKVSCFYALHDKKDDGCTDDRCGTEASDYKIRPVELTDMFPDTEGTKHDSTTYGRTPGFNWSQFAINEKKDVNFPSNPPAYVKKVQKLGYGVYDEKYLDYSFYLKRDDLKKIRRAANDDDGYKHLDNGNPVDENMTADNGLYHYRSKLFRTDGILSASSTGNPENDNVIPAESDLHCNNIKNYKERGCEVATEVGGA